MSIFFDIDYTPLELNVYGKNINNSLKVVIWESYTHLLSMFFNFKKEDVDILQYKYFMNQIRIKYKKHYSLHIDPTTNTLILTCLNLRRIDNPQPLYQCLKIKSSKKTIFNNWRVSLDEIEECEKTDFTNYEFISSGYWIFYNTGYLLFGLTRLGDPMFLFLDFIKDEIKTKNNADVIKLDVTTRLPSIALLNNWQELLNRNKYFSFEP